MNSETLAINKQVAKLLEKLLIEFTKSRARHTNDNALAESKNASIVRKYLGYSQIPKNGHRWLMGSTKPLSIPILTITALVSLPK